MTKSIDKIKEQLKNTNAPVKKEYIPSGCALLDLAISGVVGRGIQKGTLMTVPGGSHSGKSLWAGTILANTAYDKRYEDYKLVYDDSEGGFGFDIANYFGQKTADRLEVLHMGDKASETLEDLEININKLIEKGEPFIYIIDSIDSLTTAVDIEKNKEVLDAHEKGTTTTGTFAMAKAKALHQMLPRVHKKMAKTGSLLFIDVKSKDMVTGNNGKVYAGGKAIKTFSDIEAWMSPVGDIFKTVDKNKDKVGVTVRVQIKKNRNSGKPRDINIVIMHAYGIDDITTSVEWLQKYNYWDDQLMLDRIGFKKAYKLNKDIIPHIEQENLEDNLNKVLQSCWDDRESKLYPVRKSKYE